MDSKKTGVTVEMLAELKNKEILLANVQWKPDFSSGGSQTFYPYLSGDFVKRRLIEVLGAQNLQFMLEKDEEFYAKGSLGVLMENGEVNFYSAIGVEKEGRNVKDLEKKNKVKFKGNVTDTMKSCAEWLGLMVPEGVTRKTLKKDGDFVVSANGSKIGNPKIDQQKISNYLNGVSQSKYLVSQIYKLNKEKCDSDENIMNVLKSLI